jgi:hypothetical protein
MHAIITTTLSIVFRISTVVSVFYFSPPTHIRVMIETFGQRATTAEEDE